MRLKKAKISKADKNLIRDTVNTLSAMRNGTHDDEEMDGLIRSNGRSNNSSLRREERSNDGFWKALAFCMFGILILMLTDTIEFKKMKGTNTSDLAADDDVVEIFAGHVETKPPHPSPTMAPVTDPTADPTAKPVADPTADPTAKPVAKPVADPTADPTAKPVADPTAKPTNKAPEPVASPTPAAVVVGKPGRHTYKTRGQPMSDEDRKAMEDKWGKWSLEPDSKVRPKDDYYAEYPNRDVPFDKFPDNAWQKDKDWLSKFLPESIKLVDRTMNAILEEYGEPNDGTSKLYNLEKFDVFPEENVLKNEPCAKQVGCIMTKSFENLKKRLLHAIMTEDHFVFATAGHSSTAGHGNHFTQSFTLQVQWILEGVFARLGVKHQARNIALGGLGTVQTGLATKQIMGHDVDFLFWDSGMTEKEGEARDLLFRQGILGPGKVPLISSASSRSAIIKLLNEHTDADIAMIGDSEIEKTETLEEIQKLPWAKQYVNCGSELKDICRANEYMGHCWIERDDFTPSTDQDKEPGGRASWHPGNRIHQKKGRAIAWVILEALKDALTTWNDAKDYKLDDDAWHVTSLYDNTRSKLENLDPDIGVCKKYGEKFSSIMCNTAIQARTEFTPRAYPDDTSIRSLFSPSMMEYINDPPESLYEAPDVFNPDLHPPAGEVDVLNIIEAGPAYTPILDADYVTPFYNKPKFDKAPSVPVGKGYSLNAYAGYCDGSVDSWCKRQKGEKCLLYAHNDGRTGIFMDAYCGWMVMSLPKFKHGFIALKIETWHQPETNPKTKDWTSINNEGRTLTEREEPFLRSSSKDVTDSQFERQLKKPTPEYCDKFKFEFSIDGGKVTEWDKDQFLEHMGHIQRVVEVLKISEDSSLTGGEEKEVELAFRMTGCFKKQMKLTHVYWA